MRVVLLQTPPWRPDMPALGLPYVQGALKAAGVPVVLHDLNLEIFERVEPYEREYFDPSQHNLWYHDQFPAKAARILDRLGPFVDRYLAAAIGDGPCLVGLTALAPQVQPALWLAARIKAVRPGCVVVVGGASCFPQYNPREIAAHSAVDCVVVGEGERAITDLVRFLDAGGAGAPPAGVLRRVSGGGDRAVVDEGPPRPLGPLDELPFPDFSGLRLDRYLDRGRLPIMFSRGCVNRCVFCVERALWERFRFRSAGRILAEIKGDMAAYGARRFEINDSLFNGNIRVLDDLCDRIMAEGVVIEWGGQAAIRKEMTPDLLARLRLAGCRFITWGLESGSQKVLDLMRKNTDRVIASRVVRDTHEAGIGQKVNIMVGFPGETEEDFRQTLGFLAENRSYIDEVNPSDAFTGIFPGTEIHARRAEYGVVFPRDLHFYWETADGANTYPVRVERFERLLGHCAALGIRSTYPGLAMKDRDYFLGDFYFHQEEYVTSVAHFERHAAATGADLRTIQAYVWARKEIEKAEREKGAAFDRRPVSG